MTSISCPKGKHPDWKVFDFVANTEDAKLCMSCWSEDHPEIAERLRNVR